MCNVVFLLPLTSKTRLYNFFKIPIKSQPKQRNKKFEKKKFLKSEILPLLRRLVFHHSDVIMARVHLASRPLRMIGAEILELQISVNQEYHDITNLLQFKGKQVIRDSGAQGRPATQTSVQEYCYW